MRNGDVDRLTTIAEQPVEFGCALMAENGVGAGANQRRPEFGQPRGSAAEGCVHAPLHALPPSGAKLVLHDFCGHASFAGLCGAQGAILIAQQPTALRGKFDWHANSVLALISSPKGRFRICG
jgi:hypothetical protein